MYCITCKQYIVLAITWILRLTSLVSVTKIFFTDTLQSLQVQLDSSVQPTSPQSLMPRISHLSSSVMHFPLGHWNSDDKHSEKSMYDELQDVYVITH